MTNPFPPSIALKTFLCPENSGSLFDQFQSLRPAAKSATFPHVEGARDSITSEKLISISGLDGSVTLA
jgi:hypothetical protein